MIVARTRADFFDAPLSLASLAVAPLCRVLVLGAVLESLTRTSDLSEVLHILFFYLELVI
jgi:hypothetical protein